MLRVDPIQERLAANIRRLAEERSIALTHLPDRAGVGRSHFWGVLAGRHAPSLKWITKVATALDVDPVELLRPQGANR